MAIGFHIKPWHSYKAFIEARFTGNQPGETQDMAHWRDRLFARIITYFLPCCTIALIPGVAMSLISGHPLIAVADLLACSLVLAIALVRSLPLTARKVGFLLAIYGLSIALIAFLSLFGPGMIYLLAVCVLTTLILPKAWGYASAVVNILICTACFLLTNAGIIDAYLQAYSLGAWIAVCSNLAFLSFVVVAVLNYAIDGLIHMHTNDVMLRAEHQKAIRNLEYSERRLKRAQALAHVGSWELSFATGIALWSEEACRIYGLAPDDQVQSYENWASYNHPEDTEQVMEMIHEARQTFSNAGVYHRIIRRDGEIRHLYSESQYEFDDNGQVIGMYGIAQDITAQRESQEALRKSNERFELVNRAAREAILDWDIVQDSTFWGNGFTEIFGYAPADYHNHLLSANMHPEDREDAMNALYRILEDPAKTTLYREFRYLKADRSVAYVQIRTILIRDASGRAVRAVSSLMDVTDLVHKSKALEKQNSALREIAWIQSHEIRSPLAGIMGLTEMLKHKEEHELPELQLIEELHHAAARLDTVIREIVLKTEAFEQSFETAAGELHTQGTFIAHAS